MISYCTYYLGNEGLSGVTFTDEGQYLREYVGSKEL